MDAEFVVPRAADAAAALHAPADAQAHPAPEAWLVLRGGIAAGLRPLTPADAPALQAHVAGLSDTARHNRFHGALKGLSRLLAEQLCRPAGADSWACGLWLPADGTEPGGGAETLIAEARWVRDAWGGGAEFGLSVADAWQGQGIAAALLDELATRARAAGVNRLVGEVLRDNVRMRALLARKGFAEAPAATGTTHMATTTVRCTRELGAAGAGTGRAAGWWSLLGWCLGGTLTLQ